jgi:hypothetical protein
MNVRVIVFPVLAYNWSKRRTKTRFSCIAEPLLALLQMYDGFVWSNVFNNSAPFSSSESVCFFFLLRFKPLLDVTAFRSCAPRGYLVYSTPFGSVKHLPAYSLCDHVLPVMALVLLPTATATQPVQSPPLRLVTIMVFIPIYIAQHTKPSCECNSPC